MTIEGIITTEDSKDKGVAISNADVWKLIKEPKWLSCDKPITFLEGKQESFRLETNNKENIYDLDINRRCIELKYTFQTRLNTSVRLIRLDINQTHTNPNVSLEIEEGDPFFEIHKKCIGKKFDNESHIHIYREGFDDRWAYPVSEIFNNPSDIESTFKGFLGYCNIKGDYKVQGVINDYFR